MTDTLGSRRATATALGFGALVALLLANIVTTISLDDGSAITRASQIVVAGPAMVLVGIGARVPARLAGINLAAAADTLAVVGRTIRVSRDEQVTIGTPFGALSVDLLLANAFASTFGAIQGIRARRFSPRGRVPPRPATSSTTA